MPALVIEEFTDPGCPWAFSAEPARLRLRWLYGDAIEWRPRMVVLSQAPEDYEAKGFTPERQASALATIARKHGMPIEAGERSRMHATLPACRAVVGLRLHAPALEKPLLRRLRVLGFSGQLIDEPDVLAGAALDVGLDPDELDRFAAGADTAEALEADRAAARDVSAAALALDHKLADSGPGDWGTDRRYTCPSYTIELADGSARLDVPGFQPAAAYEAAIANLAPELPRRPPPESVAECLEWAGEPLATAEVACVCELEPRAAREELARVAGERPVGADGYWSLAA